jgi:hypothetical protein
MTAMSNCLLFRIPLLSGRETTATTTTITTTNNNNNNNNNNSSNNSNYKKQLRPTVTRIKRSRENHQPVWLVINNETANVKSINPSNTKNIAPTGQTHTHEHTYST